MLNPLKRIYRSGRTAARSVILPILRPRRFNACCCGLSKTGTHSLAGIFDNYRCAHHPDAGTRLPLAMDYLNQGVSAEQAKSILGQRDRYIWLEMESSSLAGILIKPLAEVKPTKKFILTIRDVFSWCDSWLDHNINSPPNSSSPWAKLDQIRLNVRDTQPTKYDAPLLERGLLPLACYFQLWTNHNQRVLDTLSDERLLIVRTQEIIEAIPVMARWLDIPVQTLQPEKGWLFAAPEKHRTLATLDSAYVSDTAEALCGSLMRRFFPGNTIQQTVAEQSDLTDSLTTNLA